MPADRPRGPGRPAHEPTDETRELVAHLVGLDKSVADIAEALGLSEPTVRAHYEAELASPRPQINFPFLETAEPSRPASTTPTRAGRPGHVPNKKSRDRVQILLAGGMRQWQIAAVLGISEPTLREHYSAELETGRARKTAEVIEAMFKAATDGGNVSAQKAFLAQPRELDQKPAPTQPKPESLGKKQAANLAAFSAAEGTDWANLLPN